MSAVGKALIGVCCWVSLPLIGVSFGVFATGGIQDNESLRQAVLVFVYAGMALYFVAMVFAIVHIARRDDLDAARSAKWLLALFFFHGFALPVFWWRLIRPLPPPT